MPAEPQVKRTVAFIDGQNLFHSARSAFGYNYPNYDVTALAQALCQDLSEVAAEVRVISTEQARWIKMASAYPVSPAARNRRGINSTDWIHIDRALYDTCIDPRDYRPKKAP